MRLALLTSEQHPNLYGDEAALPAAFAAAGHDARPAVWSDGAVDWRAFDRIVIRSPWDYFERIGEFRAWLDARARDGARLSNPLPLVRWNLDKRYLLELAARGVAVVPTEVVEERVDLAALVARRGWRDVVVKPAISGGSFRTHRFADGRVEQAALDGIVADRAALVQPFLPEIVDDGEHSLVFFAGEFSHAVVKRPARGDFRVQVQWGGTYEAVTPAAALLEDARRVLAALPLSPDYVRIDGIRRDGRLVLMEVEALEPYLFLPFSDGGAARYVAAVTRP